MVSRKVEPVEGPSVQILHDGFPNIDWSKKDDVHVMSLSRESVKLADLWKDRKVVIVFLRRFECQTCLTYIILFAHLKPILKKGNVRLVFLTCHSDLTEVNTFLVAFGFWLRKIEADASRYGGDADDASAVSGALPGELYLDPDRQAYRYFGITPILKVPQRKFLVLLCYYWYYSGVMRKKPKRDIDKVGKWYLYLDTRRRLWGNSAVFFKGPDPEPWKQSPGVAVVENDKLLYRYVCRDQLNTIPTDPNTKLAEALACPIPGTELLDETVNEGLRDFSKALDNMDKLGDVRPDEFKIIKRLGQGRESEVYSCEWMGSKVAVKFFKMEDTESDEFGEDGMGASTKVAGFGKTKIGEGLKSFANEAAILMSMRHLNVIPFVGFGNRPPRHFLITELMSRGSLFNLLANPSIQLDEAKRKEFLLGTVWGMNYLHTCTPMIIHQDLKSLNILVSEDWTVKVSDFGIARALRMQTRATKNKKKSRKRRKKKGRGNGQAGESNMMVTGSSGPLGNNGDDEAVGDGDDDDEDEDDDEDDEDAHGGTVQWMSPEQILGQKPTTKMDVFAFAVVMWEVATRKTPWRGVSHHSIQDSILEGRRLTVPAFGWNKGFQKLVNACWSQNAKSRPDFAKIGKELKLLTVPAD
ncbi:kinase-like domain-containing protein [Chytridium lagenaria]|nr:kinase-like domain-containing protein [Chytridium lagenaria]